MAAARGRPGGEDRGRSTLGLPPRAPAAASESSEAKLASSVAARDLKVAYAYSTAGGSNSGGSGTSSTTYTSSRDSVLSSEPGLQLLGIDDEEKAKRLQRAKCLAMEFCHRGGDVGVLRRWLSEMGVGWVLDVADDPSAETSLLRAQPRRNNLTERWIWALTEITFTESTYPEYILRGTDVPGRVQLLLFVEAAVLKMLPFVDTLLAAEDLDASPDSTAGVNNGAQTPSEKLQTLLCVRDALSSSSEGIQLCSLWDSAEMEAQRRKLSNLLSEKKDRFNEAIWNTMEEVRSGRILNDDDDNNEWGIQTSQGSPGICKITRSLATYIKYLWDDYSRLNHIVWAAAELGSYVPNLDIISSFLLSAEQVKTNPFTTLALEMVSSLEVKLAKRAESFPDHSVRLLFLTNNTHFIRQQLYPFFSMKYKEVIGLKIDDYIQKYLQASWAPVMSCLYNHTPRCCRTNSKLPKFDSEFEKTYTAQMLWKVPDPELRTLLRKAIVKKVVPGLRRYLEANNIKSPGVSPQEREKMLLQLFEG